MNRLTAFAGIAAVMPLAACAATVTETEYRSVAEDDYRISVEIPLEASEFEDEQILRVDELLDERTEFDPSDFQLDEVVLVARSAGGPGSPDAAGSAELLVLEWRSGAYDIPVGAEGDWYEVRIPAPDEDPGGGWLLDLSGEVTLDFLVVVMQPRPRVVAEKTVYRTRTVYRTVDGHHHGYPAYWIYDPTRYYVYHYHHDLWPYRYFAGVWDFRFYHVGFRPHYHRFGRYYGPRYDDVIWRDRYRADRRRYRHGRDPIAWRLSDAGEARPRVRYETLKRTNTRLRAFHGENAVPRTAVAPSAGTDDARSRYEEAKRTHPRLRQLHRNRNNASERESSSAVPERATTATRGSSSGNGAVRRVSPRQTADAPRRIPTLRDRPPTIRSAPTTRSATTSGAPTMRSPTARQATVRQQPATRSTGNVRTRTFHQPRSVSPRSAPTVRSPPRPSSRANVRTNSIQRSARTSSPRTSAPVRATPRVQPSSPARSASNPRQRELSRH